MTVIIVAHRLSAIQSAHQIIVIESGHITGQGNHNELMAKNVFYSCLLKEQAGREEQNSF